jgi:hypothetical protein
LDVAAAVAACNLAEGELVPQAYSKDLPPGPTDGVASKITFKSLLLHGFVTTCMLS